MFQEYLEFIRAICFMWILEYLKKKKKIGQLANSISISQIPDSLTN